MEKNERQEETDFQCRTSRKQGFVNCNYKNNKKKFSKYCHISGNYYLELGMQDYNNA